MYAGPPDGCVDNCFLRRRAALRSRLREVEVKAEMSHITAIVLLITVATLIYLLVTLLYPEKF
jgi:K+-transporting ATPase KdpF subunit